jgi:hypothetical protein
MNYKKNCMSYWFPKLVKTGIAVPKTIMVDMKKVDPHFLTGLRKIFWMKEPNKEEVKALGKFRMILEKMGHEIGYPFFLRTGQTSHKHEWLETCFIKSQTTLMKQAQNLAEWSIMVTLTGGLPINVWVARKIIEIKPIFKAFGGEMPITKEMRYFFKDHKMLCSHPYWPEHAIKDHTEDKDWKSKLKKMNKLSDEDKKTLKELTNKVAKKFDGYWSIDWLKSKQGKWFAIDMATGDDSFHFKGCPNIKKKNA